ncbi:MAG TPA: hypothetical protein VF406_02420 [Thermodesulfobacteriota bacterium]
MTTRMGLLLTITEPRPEHDEEFNAWYDTEHLAERLAIPGFLSARRWQRDGAPGEGRYLATYDLESPEVLETPEYLAHVGDNFTPWSKRCLSRAVVFRRWACEQILPGRAAGHADAAAVFLACRDVPAEHEAEFNRWYDEEHVPMVRRVPGVLGARRFRASSGSPRYLALYDLAHERVAEDPAWLAAGQTGWSRRIAALTAGLPRLLAVYRAYP